MRLLPFVLPDSIFAPAPDQRRVGFLWQHRFAHRGLHDSERIENSRAAALAAIAAGQGIELDVQRSLNGEAFVFHDDRLDRLTSASGRLVNRTSVDLAAMKLKGSEETIPRLTEILGLIAGQVPVLIEIKSAPGARIGQSCLAVRHALEGYRGAVAVMSFDPDVPLWFARHAPRIVRGLVVSRKAPSRTRHFFAEQLMLWRARAEFLAVDVRDLPNRFVRRQRARGLPVLCWTVRSTQERQLAALYADQPIGEGPNW